MTQKKIHLAILFADITQSTRLFELHGDDAARAVIAGVFSSLGPLIKGYGATLVKTIGDEILCVAPSAENAALLACDIQREVSHNSALAAKNVRFRIGLHFGEALLEDNDVFGDAVNVAARLVGIAKGNEIITSRATVDRLSANSGISSRFLNKIKVKGREEEVEIYALLWEKDVVNQTLMVKSVSPTLRPAAAAVLLLQYFDHKLELGEKRPLIRLGRGEDNDLIVEEASASRNHASLECRKGDKFVLSDHSTNGTGVRLHDGKLFFAHREEFQLYDSGEILLGYRSSSERLPEPVYYEIK